MSPVSLAQALSVLACTFGGEPAVASPSAMDRQLTHLVRLVDDLLDVSRISRGKIELRKERLDLAEIIDAALEMSESGFDRADHCLTVSVPPQPLPVEGDRVRLVQVVSNLLNNAAKFTDAGGHIGLRVTPQGARVGIQVRDNGRGIPRERLTDIFELFAQAEPARGGGSVSASTVKGALCFVEPQF
jgi:signal transduction histidine kinase